MPPSSSTSNEREIARQLDALLTGQLARIRRRFLLHGLGAWLAIVAALTLTYYITDRGLDLPTPVRVVITIGIAAYLLVAMRAKVAYPLTRAFRRDDIAVALERRFPELKERLISAVQLADMTQPSELRNQSAAMISRLLEETAEAVHRVPAKQLLDPGRTARVWAAAAVTLSAILVAALVNPESFGVFFQRVAGLSTAYPRLTTLIVELPEGREQYQISRGEGRATVTMAAGDELPVVVKAEGVIPREVILMISGGRGMAPEVSMTSRSADRFRHVFRRVARGFSFHAAGGDDPAGDLAVEVVTIQPPRVASIRATLTPPAYTGRPRTTQSGGALEALQGTVVEFNVAATSDVSDANLVFLESGLHVPLARETVSDDDGTREILAGRFTITQSDRYQVHLSSTEGLRNPQPGTYPVVMLSDHAPHGRILNPTDDSLSVVLPNALVSLRVEARDDFGLTALRATVQVSKTDGEGHIELLPESTADLASTVRGHIFSVEELPISGEAPAIGDTITLRAEVVDNREPEHQATTLPGRPIHVVAHADLARRIAGHFRRIRESVGIALDSQVRLHDRLQGVAEALDSNTPLEQLRGELTVIQVGQARIQSRTNRLHLEFMRSFNLHLFNRLEESPHAQRVVEMYSTYHNQNPTPEPFVADFYRTVGAAREDGQVGSMPKTLDPILEMGLSCDRVAADLAPRAVKAMDRAYIAEDSDDLADTVRASEQLQRTIIDELRALQDRLDEWNEFQDVIIQTRSVLDNQRDVQVRTRDAVTPDGKRSRR